MKKEGIILLFLITVVILGVFLFVYLYSAEVVDVKSNKIFICPDGTEAESIEDCPRDHDLFDRILLNSRSLLIDVAPGDNGETNMEITNANDELIVLTCFFSEDFEASSSCSTTNKSGTFIGSGKEVEFLPGERKVFDIRVGTHDGERRSRDNSQFILNTQSGEYNREVVLRARLKDETNFDSDEFRVPLTIVVS